MAFPTWESTTGTPLTSATSPQSVDMPATVNAGDLLLLVYGSQTTAGDPQTPSGWTALQSATDYSTGTGAVFAKVADGTEGGGTVEVSLAATRRGAAQIIRVSGWEGTISGVELGGVVADVGAGTAPNAGSFSPSWGAEDTLWVWFVTASDDDEDVTAAPSGYSNLTSTKTGAGLNASATVGSATLANNAASEDPGAGTLSDNADFMTGVIAVRPDGGGGGGGITLPLLHAIQES